MATVILKVLKFFDKEQENTYLKEYVEKTFANKGNEVISKNHKAIDYAIAVLNELDTSMLIEQEDKQVNLSTKK